MKYLLDTNACTRYINGRSPQIRQKMAKIPLVDIAVSTITKAELFYGSAKSQTPEISLKKQEEFLVTLQSVSFDESAARIYGPLRAKLEKQGTSIGQNVMLIAAIAVTHSLILVTHNIKEFSRVDALELEDWEI